MSCKINFGFISELFILFINYIICLTYLFKLSLRDDSNKWSNIGFGKEICILSRDLLSIPPFWRTCVQPVCSAVCEGGRSWSQSSCSRRNAPSHAHSGWKVSNICDIIWGKKLMEGLKNELWSDTAVLHGLWSEPGLFVTFEHLQKTLFPLCAQI